MRLVDRGFQEVRGICRAVRVPADIELQLGDRAIGIGRFDVEPVAAGLRRERQTRRLVGGNGEIAIGDAPRGFHRLIIPGRVLAIPLIARLDLEQLIAQPAARQRAAIGRHEHHVEIGVVAFGNVLVGEQRLDADHRRFGRHRQHQLALDGAATGFAHTNEDLCLLRPRRGRRLGQRDLERRDALGIGLRQILDRGTLVAGGLLIGDAELIAGIAGPLAGGRDQQVTFELQAGGWRAIEEAALDLQLGRRIGLDQLILGAELEFDAIRHIVFDHKGGLADAAALRIGEGPHPPGAGRHRGIERQRQAAAAGALVRQHGAAELDAVGALDHQSQRRAGDGVALAVAQQRGQIHGFAGAIDAALGIDEGVGTGRHRAPGNAAIRQIEGVTLQAQEGVIRFVGGDREHRRRQTALAERQPGLKQRMAAIIGLAGGEDFVVARDQPHLGLAERLGRGQRIDEHMNAIMP